MKKMEQVDQSVRVELSHTDRFDRPIDLLTSIHPPTHRVLDVAPVRQPAPQRALSLAPVQRRVIPQPQRVLRCGIVRQLAVLDVGCGWAYLCVCVWLGGCRYVSVDYGVCYVRLSGRDGSIDSIDAHVPRAPPRPSSASVASPRVRESDRQAILQERACVVGGGIVGGRSRVGWNQRSRTSKEWQS